MDKLQYQHLVKQIYLPHTQPDISYVVGIGSQFMHGLHSTHMNIVIQILRPLKGCKLNVTHANWVGSVDSHSTSAYYTFISGNIVAWKSKK